jgi:hypothetical protein
LPARPLAIVNQAMARHYCGDSSPLGKRVRFDGDDKPYEIVGVAGDAKYLNLHESQPRTVYLNSFQEERIFSQFVLRTSVAPAAVRRSKNQSISGCLFLVAFVVVVQRDG